MFACRKSLSTLAFSQAKNLAAPRLLQTTLRAFSTPSYIVTATGPDRSGIVADITKAVLENEGSIAESKMMKMGNDFCMMLRVSNIQTPKTDSFKSMVSSVSGMKVTVYPATEVSETFVPQFQANFKLEGADNPGLVYAVTNYLAKFGIWVDDIHTETASAPFGGTQLFVMTGKVTSDQPVDAAALRAGFRELENELNVDLSLSSSSRR